jgi:hypothetical protein
MLSYLPSEMLHKHSKILNQYGAVAIFNFEIADIKDT